MKKYRIWIILLVVLFVTAGGGYLAYRQWFAPQEVTEEAVLQTATVSRGDIVISALGSGNLLPSREMDLAFESSGAVTEVLVEVGDAVRAGDVLARLDAEDLQRSVTQAEISLRQAQIALEVALEPPDEATVQAAQDSVDQAAAALRLQQIAYDMTMSSTLVAESLADAQDNYDTRLAEYNDWLRRYNEEGVDYWYVDRARQRLDDAQLALTRTRQQVEQQVQSASSSRASASDNYRQAQANLAELLAGPDLRDTESLELQVRTAEMNLAVAQENLAGAELTAPFDGIVTAVVMQEGATAGSASTITLADMDPPVIEFWVEEADMSSAVVGNPINVVFESLPDLTFPGQIARVEPTLVNLNGTTAVQMWASIDTSAHAVALFAGMNAEVEIVAGEARNALLVPVEALRELVPGRYTVFVVQSSGELEMHPVEVGLKDYVSAEILAGLEEGDIVSAGEGSSASTTQMDVPEFEMPGDGGGFMMPGGGPP